MTREELHTLMMGANTLQECAVAWKAQEDYLCEHPDDESVVQEGESLMMLEQAIKFSDAQENQSRQAA